MTTTLAYLWTPVLAALLAVGLGLLVDRVARWPLPSALLGPIGAAAAIPVSMTIYRLGGTAAVAVPVVAIAALTGFVLARSGLRERLRPGWAGAAALLAYLLYVGPAASTGHWTWPGYNFVNDTSVNMIYVDLLIHHGYTALAGPYSTTTLMQTSGVDQGYPMGAHALLATLTPLSGVHVAAAYQPFIASVAAGAAAAVTQLARRSGAPGPVAAGIAVVAVGAHLLYRYGQHGAIKEIVTVLLLVTATAVVGEALAVGVRAGTGVVLALCLAPMLLVLSVGGAPYALLAAALAVIALLIVPKRSPLRLIGTAALTGLVTAVVADASVLSDVVSYGRGAGTSFEAAGNVTPTPATLGHLLRPLPLYQAAGIWFGEDYRGPMPQDSRTMLQTVLIALTVALAGIGAVLHLRRRSFAAPLLLATCGLTALFVAPRLSPYADAKLLVVLSPAVVLMAGLGIWELARHLPRFGVVVPVSLALACGGGVAWSDATAAHQSRLAPPDRLNALEDAAEHTEGGYWLVNEWEEYAKYFARTIRSSSGSESESPDVVVLRTPGPIFGQYFDLDEQALEFLHRFDGIIVRRSPIASRPPADFRRVYTNRYYELWRRNRSTMVLDHLPLGQRYDRGDIPACNSVRRLARVASDERGMLLAATAPTVARMDVVRQSDRPPGWVPDPARPGIVALSTPGRLRGTVDVEAAGRYRVWLQFTSGREMGVRIDGRRIGSPSQVNTPEQWLDAGDLALTGGRHEVELYRRGGQVRAGDGYRGELGPVALEPLDEPQRIVRVGVPRAERLCGRRWDWIEAGAGKR